MGGYILLALQLLLVTDCHIEEVQPCVRFTLSVQIFFYSPSHKLILELKMFNPWWDNLTKRPAVNICSRRSSSWNGFCNDISTFDACHNSFLSQRVAKPTPWLLFCQFWVKKLKCWLQGHFDFWCHYRFCQMLIVHFNFVFLGWHTKPYKLFWSHG